MSCFVLEIFAIRLLSCPKLGLTFDVFGPPAFFVEGPQISDLILEATVTVAHVAKFGVD